LPQSYHGGFVPVKSGEAAVHEAARLIRGARHPTAFTGAGISVESGIPPFRGEGGLWSKYDPRMLEMSYFRRRPERSWLIIRRIFYDHFGAARPNCAHEVLVAWEVRSLVKTLVTQNVDSVSSN
jgi:NAD-dependent deacetylase